MGAASAGIPAISGIIGGIVGNSAAQGDRDAAKNDAAAAYQRLLNVGLPPDESKQIILQQFHQAGILTPELEQTINLGPSQVAGIQEAAAPKAAQMSALQLLGQRAATGLNPEDRAAFNQLRQQAAQDQQSKQAQILQNFQQRGMGGSGAELAAALQQGQGSANQESAGADKLAAQASQNALQAAMQSGQLGGQIRQQDFGVQEAKASAADQFNRFNVQNQQAQQQRNVAAGNQAQQYNIGNAQQAANANTYGANQEANRESQAQRQYWLDKNAQASGQANALLGSAAQHNAQANTTANQYAGAGAGIGAGIGAIANYNSKKKPDEFENFDNMLDPNLVQKQ